LSQRLGKEVIQTLNGDNIRLADLIEEIHSANRRSWGFGVLPDALGAAFGIDTIIPKSSTPRNMFIGAPDSASPLHRDQGDILAIQLIGTKVWRLIPASEPNLSTRDRQNASGVEISALNINEAAALLKQRGRPTPSRLTLGSGDALILPNAWWHEVRAKTYALSISVPLASIISTAAPLKPSNCE